MAIDTWAPVGEPIQAVESDYNKQDVLDPNVGGGSGPVITQGRGYPRS